MKIIETYIVLYANDDGINEYREMVKVKEREVIFEEEDDGILFFIKDKTENTYEWIGNNKAKKLINQ